jgi:hypothetical protein
MRMLPDWNGMGSRLDRAVLGIPKELNFWLWKNAQKQK